MKLKEQGEEIQKGFLFGLSWTNHWLKVEITIPKEVRASEQIICQSALSALVVLGYIRERPTMGRIMLTSSRV